MIYIFCLFSINGFKSPTETALDFPFGRIVSTSLVQYDKALTMACSEQIGLQLFFKKI